MHKQNTESRKKLTAKRGMEREEEGAEEDGKVIGA